MQTTSAKEVQGTVIAWDNFCNQAAMIVSPMVVAEIYPRSKEGVYYFSSLFSVIALVIMIYMSCRKDAKKLGKETTGGLMKIVDKGEENDIELKMKYYFVCWNFENTVSRIVIP